MNLPNKVIASGSFFLPVSVRSVAFSYTSDGHEGAPKEMKSSRSCNSLKVQTDFPSVFLFFFFFLSASFVIISSHCFHDTHQ